MIRLLCTGCGREQPAPVDAATALPFRCVDAVPGDDIDHVVTAVDRPNGFDAIRDRNAAGPILRWRRRLSAYALATARGMDDAAFCALTEELLAAIGRVDGAPVRATRLVTIRAPQARLHNGLYGKLEAEFASGSHKARHLIPVMLWLLVAEATGLLHRDARRPLAIASCGNAALAAATIAAAAEWPIEVFVPVDAPQQTLARLEALGATVVRCAREPDRPGDPCVLAARAATDRDRIAFCVQGSECGLTIEGAELLAFETVEQLIEVGALSADERLDVVIQIGGGALASGFSAGLDAIGEGYHLFPVQMRGGHPVARALERAAGLDDDAIGARGEGLASPRSAYMWPWTPAPESAATGILDDETYDYRAVVAATRRSRGAAIVVEESELLPARTEAEAAAGVALSFTGVAGLAGARQAGLHGPTLVLLSGRRRGADPG